jgi:hypothetical protein
VKRIRKHVEYLVEVNYSGQDCTRRQSDFGGVLECGERSKLGERSKRCSAEHLYLLDGVRDVLLDHQQALCVRQ